MSPVRQAAHWIGSVLIFKANHWEFGSSMLLRHTHVASWQVIFEKPSKCTSIQIFKCSLFSCGFFKPLTFANKNHGRFTCQQGKKCSVDASAVRFFFCGETQLIRRGGGTGGTWELGIVSARVVSTGNRKCVRPMAPYDRYKWSYLYKAPYKLAKWKWVIGGIETPLSGVTNLLITGSKISLREITIYWTVIMGERVGFFEILSYLGGKLTHCKEHVQNVLGTGSLFSHWFWCNGFCIVCCIPERYFPQ